MTLFNTLVLASMKGNLENVLTQGLPIMVAGMLGIVVVIGIIILTGALLGKTSGDELFAKGIKELFSRTK